MNGPIHRDEARVVRATNRRLLGSIMVLGVVTTALGGFGVFAAFTDSVLTGQNTVKTVERDRVADLEIAMDGVTGPQSCATAMYVSETTTPFFNVTVTGGVADRTFFCLRNVGTSTLTVVSTILDFSQIELGCTGDEKPVDPSCGADGVGEIGPVLVIEYYRVPYCDPQAREYGSQVPLVPAVAHDWGTMKSHEMWCGYIGVELSDVATEEQLQAAQTDQAAWRFVFEGTAGS
jgi:hypothetical protein